MTTTLSNARSAIEQFYSDGDTDALETLQDHAIRLHGESPYQLESEAWRTVQNAAMHARHVVQYRSDLHNLTADREEHRERLQGRLEAHEAGFKTAWDEMLFALDQYETDNAQALVLIGEWGTGAAFEPVEGFEGYAYTLTDAPDWLEGLDHLADYVTVLHNDFGGTETPEGWELVTKYQAGEKECPTCGCGTDGEGQYNPDKCCPMCDNDQTTSGHVYWGEEWAVSVFKRSESEDE